MLKWCAEGTEDITNWKGYVMKLPTWIDVSEKFDSGECLNPLENFIYCYEPADGFDGLGGENFRDGLLKMFDFVIESKL